MWLWINISDRKLIMKYNMKLTFIMLKIKEFTSLIKCINAEFVENKIVDAWIWNKMNLCSK